ncbi:hypothetical protein BMF89_20460 [Arthrobacter sp. SRS-W-1-2016]|nr:hypothetical protein BMF89_20460 [Arthrobacter sp. SRS-W-1-2016]
MVIPFLLVAAALLSGCSNAGSTTCDQYAAQSFSQRQDTEQALLAAHGLDKYSIANTVGIVKALSNYCGVGGLGGEPKAGKNGGSQLDQAVDWTSTKW